MFEKASRLKLRFQSTAGMLTVEDLWELPLTRTSGTSLDSIAKAVNKELKDTAEESFVTTATAANTELALKLDILKYIISVKLQEAENRKTAAEKRERKAHIMQLIADKQDEELRGKSLEDLQKELDQL